MVEKKGWNCKECDASFRWLVWGGYEEPENKKEWQEAELFTNFGMYSWEFYPVGKNGIELDDKPCEECMERIRGL